MIKQIVVAGALILFTLSSFSQKLITQEKIINRNYQEVIDPAFHKTNIPDSARLDKYPMYPDGFNGVLEHIYKTTRYPIEARERGISGTVVLRYVIDKDGKIREIEVIQSVDEELDTEAIRVISKMKQWVPGFKDGKPVRVEYKQPFKFTLRD